MVGGRVLGWETASSVGGLLCMRCYHLIVASLLICAHFTINTSLSLPPSLTLHLHFHAPLWVGCCVWQVLSPHCGFSTDLCAHFSINTLSPLLSLPPSLTLHPHPFFFPSLLSLLSLYLLSHSPPLLPPFLSLPFPPLPPFLFSTGY